MPVLINQENITGELNLDAAASLLQDLDEYSVLVEWAPQATTGIDTLWGHAANAANNYGVSMQVADNGDSTYNFRATLKGDTDLTAGETPANETSPIITVPTATVIRATALFRSAGNYEIYANGLSDTQAISPAIEPLSNYNLDTVRINSINGSTPFAGTTAKLYVIDRIVDAGEIAAWEASATVPDLASVPTIASISNFSAGATATITVDAYDTVSAVAIDATSITSGIVEQTATTISFPVGYDETKIGTSVDVTVTDSGGTSTAFSATYNAPAGYTGVLITSLATSPALSLLEVGDWWGTDNSNFVVSVDGTVSLAVGTPDGDTANWLLIQNQAAFSGTFTATEDAVDTESPVITLVGATSVNVTQNASFVDLGATWTDNVDGSGTVYATESVNTATLGAVGLTYSYTDAAGNASPTLNRTVTVVATAIAAPSNLSGMVYSGTSGQYTSEENSPFSFDVVVTNLLGPVTLSGLDSSLFSIALVTGSTYRVTSIARDYELPEDSNSDNIYNVTVNCNGVALGTQITITDVSEVVPDTSAPVLSSVVIPTIDVLANTDFEVTFNSDEEGIFYWVITSSATPPSKPFTNTAVMDIGSNAIQANAGPSTNTHFHYYAEDNA